MTTIKQLLRTISKEMQPPVFSFKWTQEAKVHNITILAAFRGNLGGALESQKVSLLDYVSEFQYPTGIANLFFTMRIETK